MQPHINCLIQNDINLDEESTSRNTSGDSTLRNKFIRKSKYYHSKMIDLSSQIRDRNEIKGGKRIKLNNWLAYIQLQIRKRNNQEIIIHSQNKWNNINHGFQIQSQQHDNQDNMKIKLNLKQKSKSYQCRYRLIHPQYSSFAENKYNYNNLKTLFSSYQSNPFSISSFLSSDLTEITLSYIESYNPKQFLIYPQSSLPIQLSQSHTQANNNIINNIKQENDYETNNQNNQISLLQQSQHSCCYFSFQDSVNIKLKEMEEESLIRMKKTLKSILYLYLNGDYRGINDNHILNEAETDNFAKPFSNRYVSYKYKSKHINFDYCSFKQSDKNNSQKSMKSKNQNDLEKEEENNNNNNKIQKEYEDEDDEEDEEEQLFNMNQNKQQQQDETTEENNKKKIIYNKSKYVMQLFLRLLDRNHLEQFTIPEGFQDKLINIQKNIIEQSKKNKQSQSQFYNHTHFDCLFLQITQNNYQYIMNNQELLQMHLNVFEIPNLTDTYSINTVNLFKEIIIQIILSQTHLIRYSIIPQLAIHTLSFKSSSKLKYFQRICDSIEKLKEGKLVNKF